MRGSLFGAAVVAVVVGATGLFLWLNDSTDREARVSTRGAVATPNGVELPSVLNSRGGYAMSAVEDRYIFVFGGFEERDGKRVAPGDGAIYDIAAKSWRHVTGPDGLAIGDANSYSDESGTYVIGRNCSVPEDAEDEGACRPGTVEVMRYDPGSNAWDVFGRPDWPAGSLTYMIGAAAGRVYVVTQPNQIDAPVHFDAYDQKTERWEKLPSPPRAPRASCFSGGRIVNVSYGATLNGTVLPDGQSPPGLAPAGSTNISASTWDAANNTWSETFVPIDLSGNIAPKVGCGDEAVVVIATVDPGATGPLALFKSTTGTWEPLPPAALSGTNQAFLVSGDTVTTWSGTDGTGLAASPGATTWTPVAGLPPATSFDTSTYGHRSIILASTDQGRVFQVR